MLLAPPGAQKSRRRAWHLLPRAFFTSEGARWCLQWLLTVNYLLLFPSLLSCWVEGYCFLTMWVIAWEETPVLPWRHSDLSGCLGSHSGKMKMLCVYFAFTPRCKGCTRSNTVSCGLPLLLNFIMCRGHAGTFVKTVRVANRSTLCKQADSWGCIQCKSSFFHTVLQCAHTALPQIRLPG